MLIELSELLACPSCQRERGAEQGLVVLVGKLDDHRVSEGELGCPACERRFPIEEGEIFFDLESPDGTWQPGVHPSGANFPAEERSGGSATESGSGADADPGGKETAVTVAALLGVRAGAGHILLGGGLLEAATDLSRLLGGMDVLVLVPGGAGATSAAGSAGAPVTPIHSYGRAADHLPFLSSRLRGVALRGGSPAEVREAVRVCAPGSRVVVLRPGRALLEEEDFGESEVVAAEPAALVLETSA